MPRDRFGPYPLTRYLAAFDEELAPAIKSRFYLAEDLALFDQDEGAHKFFCIEGSIRCEGAIRVDVQERLQFAPENRWLLRSGAWRRVRLVRYSYSMVLTNVGSVFRYDSPHAGCDEANEHPVHHLHHHVHRFDVLGTGLQVHPPKLLQPGEVPSVRQVLEEAETWHYRHAGVLRRSEV